MARVQVIKQTSLTPDPGPTDWSLWLQWCRYLYDDDAGSMDYGYRYIWKRPGGALQAARGQARVPSMAEMEQLIAKAKAEGWGDYDQSYTSPKT